MLMPYPGCEIINALLWQSWDSFLLDNPPVAHEFLTVRISQ